MITIDEGMNCVEKAIPKSAIRRMYDELKWWRKQDFIRREDVLESIEQIKRLEKHIDHVIVLQHVYCAIGEIPKAEPPKEEER